MNTPVDPFDLNAAILRRNEQDMRAFLAGLAARLDGALPGRVVVTRKRDGLLAKTSHVVRIELAVDDAVFAIALDRAGVKTTRAKVVRAVTIATAAIAPAEWIAEVRAAVSRLSDTAGEASAAIGTFL